MCAEAEGLFHVAGILDVLGFGREIVEIGDDDCLLHAWKDRRPELLFAMMGEDAMDDAFDLLATLDRDGLEVAWSLGQSVLQYVLEGMCRDVDVAQEIHVFGSLAFAGVLHQLAIVMEENGEDATLGLDRIGQDWIETFEHVEHLPGVVQQSALEGMVHTLGRRILGVGLIELLPEVLDDADEFGMCTEGDEVLDGSIPVFALDGMWHEVPEGMTLFDDRPCSHISGIGRLLAVAILYGVESYYLTLFRTCLWGTIPNSDVDCLLQIGTDHGAIGRPLFGHSIGA